MIYSFDIFNTNAKGNIIKVTQMIISNDSLSMKSLCVIVHWLYDGTFRCLSLQSFMLSILYASVSQFTLNVLIVKVQVWLFPEVLPPLVKVIKT